MDEFPDGAYALVGTWPHQNLVVRKDDRAQEHGWGNRRWFPVDCTGDPVAWEQLSQPRRVGAEPEPVQRLYTQHEVDQVVSEAIARTQLQVVGEHIIEPGGYCRTCTSHHSTTEVARLEDRLAEEEGERR